jgi:pyridoxamine 5'-phosphate oxidase
MINTKGLSKKTVDPNPFVQFEIWYKEHLSCGIAIPGTVSLGTASAGGRVSVRIVLLKGYDENGFVFFTNYKSKKGIQISENPGVALLFYWPELDRQVRIEGIIEKTSEKESSDYFMTRPRESQIAAWASEQSSIIPDRRHLEKLYDFYKDKFDKNPVEKPPYWGGYRIVPDFFEFWQDGEFRLHNRVVYSKVKDTWIIECLAP